VVMLLALFWWSDFTVRGTVLIKGKEKQADERRRILATGTNSDHLMLANAFQVLDV